MSVFETGECNQWSMKWVDKNPLAQGCMRLIVAGDHNSLCPGKGRKF